MGRFLRDHVKQNTWGITHDPAYYNFLQGGSGYIVYRVKATFQWFDVPAYHGNTIKRISSKPKGYIADTGLVCYAQSISSPQAIGAHPLWGALFETAVVNEIRKQCSLLNPMPNMYHWRTHREAEVDIILERDGIFSNRNKGNRSARSQRYKRDTCI